MTTPVLIDADPGVDDFLAILLAIRSPEIAVEAVTTVGGNCPLRLATRNALRVIEYSGQAGIPVFPGAARPTRGHFKYAPGFHGISGLTGRMRLPTSKPADGGAHEALVQRLSSDGSPMPTVVALGPLTNIARLVQTAPEIASRIPALVVMGGAMDCPGNVTPWAEFNIWNDPEAANIVLSSGLNIRLIGLDVCNRVRLRPDDVVHADRQVRRMMQAWFARRDTGDEFAMCDPLAVSAVIDASLFKFEHTPVQVVTEGEQRGRTIRARQTSSIEVAVDVDVARATALFDERLSLY